jgi:hypothetical protein
MFSFPREVEVGWWDTRSVSIIYSSSIVHAVSAVKPAQTMPWLRTTPMSINPLCIALTDRTHFRVSYLIKYPSPHRVCFEPQAQAFFLTRRPRFVAPTADMSSADITSSSAPAGMLPSSSSNTATTLSRMSANSSSVKRVEACYISSALVIQFRIRAREGVRGAGGRRAYFFDE